MTDDPLARRLRDAADALTPAFSPALHDRFVRGLRPSPAPGARPTVWRIAAVAAVAAAVLVASAVVSRRPAPPRRTVVPAMPSWPGPVAVRWPDVGYGDLDRDAGRAARYLIHQLDCVPTAGGRSPTSRSAAGMGA